VLEPVRKKGTVRQVGERVVERLARELVDPHLVGAAQGRVLDYERSLQRELVHEPPLLRRPVPPFTGLGADHETQGSLRRQQRERHI
jgi:hypothetical protein